MNGNFSKDLFCTCVLSFYSIFMHAQQWVWHEIAEEDDGGSPIGGLVVLAFIFGIVWLFSDLFGSKKEPSKKPAFVVDPAVLEYQNFTKKCIEIYGDYAAATCGLVLIKEDGEYRQIASSDKRFDILSSYVFKYHKERRTNISAIGDFKLLSFYIDMKEFNVFPLAKPMESHGQLEKEFYGEQIIMMMAYYDRAKWQYCIGSRDANSLRDFCLSLGLELSIYIHKYMKRPMEMGIFHDLKDMTLRKMTVEEYIAYRSKVGRISERDNKWFDGEGNYIGETFAEASSELHKREVYSYEQAIKDIKEINWSL